jgi:hypothetical protein
VTTPICIRKIRPCANRHLRDTLRFVGSSSVYPMKTLRRRIKHRTQLLELRIAGMTHGPVATNPLADPRKVNPLME